MIICYVCAKKRLYDKYFPCSCLKLCRLTYTNTTVSAKMTTVDTNTIASTDVLTTVRLAVWDWKARVAYEGKDHKHVWTSQSSLPFDDAVADVTLFLKEQFEFDETRSLDFRNGCNQSESNEHPQVIRMVIQTYKKDSNDKFARVEVEMTKSIVISQSTNCVDKFYQPPIS